MRFKFGIASEKKLHIGEFEKIIALFYLSTTFSLFPITFLDALLDLLKEVNTIVSYAYLTNIVPWCIVH